MKIFPTLGLGLALIGPGEVFAQPASPPAAEARPDRGGRMFELFDGNRDGRVVFDEAWAFVTTRFATADADRSGGLSLQEFVTMRMRRGDAPTASPTSSPTASPTSSPTASPERAARMEQMRSGMFRALDANSDGQVTLAEIRPAVEARFRAADANADGAVAREELPQHGHHNGHHQGHRSERTPAAPATR